MADKNDATYEEWRDWIKIHHTIMLGDSPNPDLYSGRRKEIAIELRQILDREYELRREIQETYLDIEKKIKEKNLIIEDD